MTKPAAAGTATDLANGSGAPEPLDVIFPFLAFAERERCLAVDGRIRLRDPTERP